jgi:hypothetical protein
MQSNATSCNTPEPITVARRWYVLVILTFVYALSIADRFVMSTLIEPIKADYPWPLWRIARIGER